jgi:hypothetical protein
LDETEDDVDALTLSFTDVLSCGLAVTIFVFLLFSVLSGSGGVGQIVTAGASGTERRAALSFDDAAVSQTTVIYTVATAPNGAVLAFGGIEDGAAAVQPFAAISGSSTVRGAVLFTSRQSVRRGFGIDAAAFPAGAALTVDVKVGSARTLVCRLTGFGALRGWTTVGGLARPATTSERVLRVFPLSRDPFAPSGGLACAP